MQAAFSSDLLALHEVKLEARQAIPVSNHTSRNDLVHGHILHHGPRHGREHFT